jgi:replicative DNA helicase
VSARNVEQLADNAAVPPNDLEAEQAVLGAIMLDNTAFYDLPSGLIAEDFYRAPHQVLFTLATELIAAKQPVDVITLMHAAEERGGAHLVGGSAYVSGLPDVVPSTANLAHYAKIVREKAIRRRMAHVHDLAVKLAHDETKPIGEIVAEVEEFLSTIDQAGGPIRRRERDVVRGVLNRVDDRFEGKLDDRAITIGIPIVDDEVRVHAQDLVVIGAPTAGGKSVLLSQIARNVGARKNPKPVLIASLEMSGEELAERRLMDVGSLSIEDVRYPRTQYLQDKLGKAADEVWTQSRVEYLERCWDLRMILREARRMKRREGLAALFIDYLQILSFPPEWGSTRDQQIGTATRMLKRFAVEENVPVILASQLRRLEGRVPTKDDLRESGNIANDANLVLILWIPGTVEGTEEWKRGDKRTARLLVAKQRQGRSMFEIDLVQVFEHARFSQAEEIPPQPTLPIPGVKETTSRKRGSKE